ncbi:MAG TPA: FAD-dependent oxidoreductase, partial [Kiritimatiellia bacterium]|nr:FAD-dependent oxidoreductase [Kiritimatiellia bacterium]
MAGNVYAERYQRLKEQTAKAKHLNAERGKHDALSSLTGVADQPKDFDWLEKNIPCQVACPAKTDIPGYLDAVARGAYEEAYRINLRDNVFPAILGRVCTRPCEPACRHGWEGLGEPVAICFSKRSAADFMERQEPVVVEPVYGRTGKRVVVIGGGAAGLAAARELVLLGHEAVVLEQHEEAGGMMVQGIPEFRLPRELVRREIEQVARTGVEIRCGVTVGRDVELGELIDSYDAVVVAAGTMKPVMPANLRGVNVRGV